MEDRNFDDLFDRFSKNIYQSLKGQIRLGVLRNDLKDAVPELWQDQPLKVLDAGGGLGLFTAEFAKLGHRVSYCDISQKMLESARETTRQQGLLEQVSFYHESVQDHIRRINNYQVIMLHAVLEWVACPQQVLAMLISSMQPGTVLSLLFYNEQSIVFKNLLRANYYRATRDNHQGFKGSLTPAHPLKPDDVKRWAAGDNEQRVAVRLLLESGVRVFYDYAEKTRQAQRSAQQVIEPEIAFSRKEPYRALGRYYHLVLKK